ncbi:MAG: nicotinate-nucleotide--dimethylbenzimidazole phosphoribosyltransferase [Victivallales bacterium]|nr:nicotinate-nucleotide--dimethylbenzimidazole phosphoribosyltransferase [Victivallales bacterium]
MSLLECTLRRIEPGDRGCREAAIRRIHQMTMPRWALGRVLDLAVDLAGMTRSLDIPVARKEIVLMAGDHGVVAEGVCPQPSEVTAQMVRNFCRGGGGVNVLAQVARAHVTLVDMGVAADLTGLPLLHRKIAWGTRNMLHAPAMTRQQAVTAVETGIALAEALVADGAQVIAPGEMGIGNSTPATAILAVLAHADDPAPFTGQGAGLPAERLAHKAEVIRQAIALHRPDPEDALDVLAKVGGFEIGGIAGLVLGAAARRCPVLLDGFISTAGALLATTICPTAGEYLILAHGSAEPGHVAMARMLGKRPLLDLGLRLGEGTGAALAMPLLDSASALMNQMTTFTDAQVTEQGLG